MEEPLFESVSGYTMRELRVAYHVYYFKVKGGASWFSIVLGGIILASLIIPSVVFPLMGQGGAVLRQYRGNAAEIVFCAVLGVVCVGQPFFRIWRAAKRACENDRQAGKPAAVVRRYYGDRWVSDYEQGGGAVLWSQVSSGHLYRRHVVLFYPGSFICIPLDALTKGEPGAFAAFVRQRVPMK